MVSESKSMKRKSTAESADTAKKIKKSSKSVEISSNTQEPTPPKRTTEIFSAHVKVPPKSSHKRAVDHFDEDEEKEAAAVKPTETSKSSKRAKKSQERPLSQKFGQATSKKSKEVAISGADPEDGVDSEGPGEDQTAALLAGFESSDEDEDESEADEPEPEGLSLDQLPEIPDENKALQQNKATSGKEKDGPGVVYIGRIPHGFYETQMRAYFSQFGKIKRLRLSRNKKTGKSKHYAFIEFASGEVADIVARTMNKYLMFGHILQVAVIPPAQVHEKLFVGANKRFRPIPRNKLEGKRLSEGADRESWAKRINTEKQRRYSRKKKLQEIGYEFEFPKLREVENVPVKETGVSEAGEGETADGNTQPKTTTEDAGITEEEQVMAKAIENKPEIAHFTEEIIIKEETQKGQKSKKIRKKAVALA